MEGLEVPLCLMYTNECFPIFQAFNTLDELNRRIDRADAALNKVCIYGKFFLYITSTYNRQSIITVKSGRSTGLAFRTLNLSY